MAGDYPAWAYYPQRDRPPEWVEPFVSAVRAVRSSIDSTQVQRLTSDLVLSHLRPGLQTLGYEVEASKTSTDRIRRPVLFGEQGRPLVTCEVDAVHDELVAPRGE